MLLCKILFCCPFRYLNSFNKLWITLYNGSYKSYKIFTGILQIWSNHSIKNRHFSISCIAHYYYCFITYLTQSSLLCSNPMQTVWKVISSYFVPLRTKIIFLLPFYCSRFNKNHVWMLSIIVMIELLLVEIPK